ncbi:hypothetical protein SAMN04488074_1363 [Lentzea albidocapillata subsp. violacea]|uniref:Uncharacterized protein n=1 Tax=Lentzea albidocapillata subsp. violacea TaxID=128104 RepID=A0A1G9YVU4_9PSEU|nr:hypothetical protein [Lentzea albidocapillata]SDN13259.1 hypothetical protein SAMN04488074_1363 [Lentzea albidocapillata subsp. violacea]
MPEPEQPVIRLSFPHSRNDCQLCREWDASVEVTDQPQARFANAPTPPERRRSLCQSCLGKYLSMIVHNATERDDDVTIEVTLALAPGRRQNLDHPHS